jgi:hypothetical protein
VGRFFDTHYRPGVDDLRGRQWFEQIERCVKQHGYDPNALRLSVRVADRFINNYIFPAIFNIEQALYIEYVDRRGAAVGAVMPPRGHPAYEACDAIENIVRRHNKRDNERERVQLHALSLTLVPFLPSNPRPDVINALLEKPHGLFHRFREALQAEYGNTFTQPKKIVVSCHHHHIIL